MYAAEQAASQLPFWAHLPWTAVAIFSVGWLFGLLYADLVDEHSQLRHWWRDRRNFGEFGRARFTTAFYDPDQNRGGNQKFIDIKVPFTFTKRTDLLSIRVTATKRRLYHDMHNPEFEEHQWSAVDTGLFLPRRRIDILIARVAVDPAHNGYYGDLSYAHIGTLEEHKFEIEAISESTVQTTKLYMKVPYKGEDMALHGAYHGDRLFLVEEKHELNAQMDQSSSRRSV